MLPRLAVLLTLCLACAMQAQVAGVTVTTEPAAPTTNTPVTIVVTSECGCPAHLVPITRDGFTIDVPYNPLCLGACAPTDVARYDVGLLASGVYTVRHHPAGDPDNVQVIGTFAVAETQIPAVGWKGLAALTIALGAIGAALAAKL